MARKKKKKIPTRTKLLWSAVVAVIGYTVASIILQFVTQTEISATLTTAWFGFWSIELWNLSRITIYKEKNRHYSDINVTAEETKTDDNFEEE